MATGMKKRIKFFIWKRRMKKHCKANGYYCPECIYHSWRFDDGGVFRGNICLFPKEWR